ncbi:hypothetical protein [Clostridium botulinum]|uniref:hypothetical protein n=1 Tax=Clostridium botulinum TaxID=1491 RepID=UPI001E4F3F3F|nr:hypothetical protein [Clostridium botulinum]MCD3254373.1 hypothetical protein [Clostridium botulinum C/D]MCD3279873.1 hypothetical protein [Clostridium botulinum C/D]MCD3339604.1 hypothetical protein [Clostridium botulinum C/D]MCD3357512.1 hypothetical protein [Clostridium botulinum C/D]
MNIKSTDTYGIDIETLEQLANTGRNIIDSVAITPDDMSTQLKALTDKAIAPQQIEAIQRIIDDNNKNRERIQIERNDIDWEIINKYSQKYITQKEFDGITYKIKQIIMKLWKPRIGDLYVDYKQCESDMKVITEKDLKMAKFLAHEYTPLLTEGQLRDMIESFNPLDKVVVDYDFCKDTYSIRLKDIDTYKEYNDLGNDLLKAYWKVLIEEIKDELISC